MKKLLVLLLPLLFISGCSNLGEKIDCVETGVPFTLKAVGESNVRILAIIDDNDGRWKFADRAAREKGYDNCKTYEEPEKEKDIKMLSGYEQLSGYFK